MREPFVFLHAKIGRFSEDNVATVARRSKPLIDHGQNRIQHQKVAVSLFLALSCSHLSLGCLKPPKRTFLKLDRALKPKERLQERITCLC